MIRKLVLALLLGVCFSPAVQAQCAMCRTALQSSPEGQAMAAGFNQAILFLLAAPILIVAGVSLGLWQGGRRPKNANQPATVARPSTSSMASTTR